MKYSKKYLALREAVIQTRREVIKGINSDLRVERAAKYFTYVQKRNALIERRKEKEKQALEEFNKELAPIREVFDKDSALEKLCFKQLRMHKRNFDFQLQEIEVMNALESNHFKIDDASLAVYIGAVERKFAYLVNSKSLNKFEKWIKSIRI